jgi:hemerythrin-like domain-containing protein
MKSDRERAVQIALEHAAVNNAIRDIRDEIDRLRSEPGPEHQAGELSGMLSAFGQHLKRHFEFEEHDGFLSDSEGFDARTQRVIDLLLAQHREFERRLVALVDGVKRAELGDGRLSDAFVEELRVLLAELVQHEDVENELVQRIVIRDMNADG